MENLEYFFYYDIKNIPSFLMDFYLNNKKECIKINLILKL